MSDPIRLAKRVAAMVPCSRREAEQYIEGGWVRVDGKVVEEPQSRVTDEQRVVLRHMNKESIDRFSTGNWNERKASPSYGDVGTLGDGDIGFEIRNELIFKIVAKKVAKSSRAWANDLQLLTIVVPGIELYMPRIVEIPVPANMVPMAMSYKYRGQWGEIGKAM